MAGGALRRGNLAHTGGTRITSGELRLLGTLAGDLTVDSGARLSGGGTVGGDLLFSAGSVYAVNVDASGNAVRLAVNGKSALQGAILEIVAANGSYGARTLYTVLTATGGILGEFGTTTSNLAFLAPALRYNDTSVELALARNDVGFVDLAQTPDQARIGAVLDVMEENGSGDMAKVIEAFNTLSVSEVSTAMEAVTGSS